MTRAILPNPSAQAEWPLAGLIHKSSQSLVRAPPLDGGGDDDDADTTTTDDDNEDISSLTSQQSTVLQLSNF